MVKKFFSKKLIFGNKIENFTAGVPEIIITCFLMSVLIGIVRELNKEYHIFFIVMMRNLFAIIALIPQFIKYRNSMFQTNNINLTFIRSMNGVLSMFLWFNAIIYLPLSEAISLSFLTPIIVTLASKIFLKERVNKNIFLSLFISFIGVIVIMRPGFGELKFGYIFCFGSIISWTVSNIITKKLVKTEKIRNIVAQMNIFMFLFSVPFAIPYFKAIEFDAFIKFLFLGIISNQSYKLIAQAYRKNELSVLQPFDFSRLIFTSLIAYIFFDENPDIWIFLGSGIILIGLIISLKKKSTNIEKKIIDKITQI